MKLHSKCLHLVRKGGYIISNYELPSLNLFDSLARHGKGHKCAHSFHYLNYKCWLHRCGKLWIMWANMKKCRWCLSDEDTCKNNITMGRKYDAFFYRHLCFKRLLYCSVWGKILRSQEVSHDENHFHWRAWKNDPKLPAQSFTHMQSEHHPWRLIYSPEVSCHIAKISLEINNNKN